MMCLLLAVGAFGVGFIIASWLFVVNGCPIIMESKNNGLSHFDVTAPDFWGGNLPLVQARGFAPACPSCGTQLDGSGGRL